MMYVQAIGHSVSLVMQIAEDGDARVYVHVLHAHFEFHLSSIYIKEEVLSESSKADKSILHLRFHDDEGHHRLFLLR
jgi:hypothetical protein